MFILIKYIVINTVTYRTYLGKNEMISYYKGSTIPTSHIHMFDPENVTLACNIFRELVR